MNENEVKTSTKIDLVLLEVIALVDASKMMNYSMLESTSKIDPEEIGGMFGVFRTALEKVRIDLANIALALCGKGD